MQPFLDLFIFFLHYKGILNWYPALMVSDTTFELVIIYSVNICVLKIDLNCIVFKIWRLFSPVPVTWKWSRLWNMKQSTRRAHLAAGSVLLWICGWYYRPQWCQCSWPCDYLKPLILFIGRSETKDWIPAFYESVRVFKQGNKSPLSWVVSDNKVWCVLCLNGKYLKHCTKVSKDTNSLHLLNYRWFMEAPVEVQLIIKTVYTQYFVILIVFCHFPIQSSLVAYFTNQMLHKIKQ